MTKKYQVTYRQENSFHSENGGWGYSHDRLRADFTNLRGAMMFIDFLEDEYDVIENSISLYDYETGYQLGHENMRQED